jgi:hypothetical protein
LRARKSCRCKQPAQEGDTQKFEGHAVLEPGTKLQETVFPVDRIKQSRDGTLYQAPLFPESVENGASVRNTERLAPLKGKEVKVFLRLLVNDQKQNIMIPFKVVDVDF